MNLTKNDLAILISLVGSSNNEEKIKKMKNALFIDNKDLEQVKEQVFKKKIDVGYNLYKVLLNEYNKLRK